MNDIKFYSFTDKRVHKLLFEARDVGFVVYVNRTKEKINTINFKSLLVE